VFTAASYLSRQLYEQFSTIQPLVLEVLMAVPLDQIFSTTILNVFVPDTSLEFPPKTSTDDWLNSIQGNSFERRQAFFGMYDHYVLRLDPLTNAR